MNFKQFLNEAPMLNTMNDWKDRWDDDYVVKLMRDYPIDKAIQKVRINSRTFRIFEENDDLIYVGYDNEDVPFMDACVETNTINKEEYVTVTWLLKAPKVQSEMINAFYEHLLIKYDFIISDGEQSLGGKSLWRRLMADLSHQGFEVGLFDFNEEKETNVYDTKDNFAKWYAEIEKIAHNKRSISYYIKN